MLTRRTLLASASASLLAGPALAQSYPTQIIRIIAGFPPGGGIDISARLMADPLKNALGQTVIVENRTGAAGMLAANTVAKASPDGHMLLMATVLAASMPAAPVRFSTITVWPSAFLSGSAISRAERSMPPPGGKPATMRTVCVG